MADPSDLTPAKGASIHSAARATRVVMNKMTNERFARRTSGGTDSEGDHEEADETGLRDAFLTHGGELFGFARRSLNSSESAEDVVQETFSRAWRSRARFDSTLGSLRTWLFTIERRVILDVTSQQVRSRTFPLDLEHQPVDDDHVEKAMLGWQMESALKRLDPEHQMVVTELYFNGRSGKEVAELFGIPEGTVRSRAYYALRMLRLLLEEGGWDQ